MASGKQQRVSRVSDGWLASFVCVSAVTLHAQIPSLHGSPLYAAHKTHSTRFTAHGVALRHGDVLKLRGIPDLRPELNSGKAVQAAAGDVHPEQRDWHDYREY